MKISAIAPWFGGKRDMAPKIVEQLGPHRCYWEPFCGSMAVLFAKPEVSQETVNDQHGALICLARVLADELLSPQLHRRLQQTLVHEELFKEAAEYLKAVGSEPPWWLCNSSCGEKPSFHRRADANMAEFAYWFFITSWLGRNGVIGTKGPNNNFCVRYTMNGGIQGTRFVAAVDSIPEWHQRLREVTILRRDGFDLLERIEDDRAVAIYCDPPYLVKGATYDHDFEPEDHQRLADALARFKKARIVVSYYDDQRLDGLYPGWTKLDRSRSKSLAVQGSRGRRGSDVEKAPEVLLINGPAIDPGKGGGLF